MKKFELFSASRATRERHFKTSSTEDNNGPLLLKGAMTRKKNLNNKETKILWNMKIKDLERNNQA